jgi:SAM-dependent methyltransferase
LVAEALAQNLSGWDFSFISHRWHEHPPPWDFRCIVLDRIRDIDSLLDMGTGGGEFLASLQPLPRDTFATEGYPPNVPIAKERLEPLGVRVVEIDSDKRIPFEDNQFDLVINRHESYCADEVYRVLKPGGSFVTQQVGGENNIRLNELLQERVETEFSYWTLAYATRQLEGVGFEIVAQEEEYPETEFRDIGAVVYYLRVISWQIPGFTVEKYADRLYALHRDIQENGVLVTRSHRFYIEALKPERVG